MAGQESQKTRVTRVTASGNEGRRTRGGEACLVVIYGPELGRRVSLGMAPFDIGRSSKSDLFIDQESISRHHARVTFDGNNYIITDLKSTNGTFVNDAAVTSTKLEDGDQVRVGRSMLKFMTGENIEVHYHEEIYRLMTVDGLTQIFNRRYFDEAIEREFNRCRRYARDLSLVSFDIDHFKKVNDTWGHIAGDNLLRHIVAAIRPRLRREDIFARTGGEEFGVLLPEISVEGARSTAEKVRRIVELSPLRFDQCVIACSVSLGVAKIETDDVSPVELYKRADACLYEAKQGGRNRSVG